MIILANNNSQELSRFFEFIKSLVKTKFFSNFLNLGSIQVSNTLLMILMIPVITRAVGVEMFGQVMVANSFATLVAVLVSYATSQTSVKDIAIAKNDTHQLSKVFSETLLVRFLFLFLVLILMMICKPVFGKDYLLYITAIPLILAEALNPLFFYLGQENLKLFNLSNLFTKILTITGILVFIHGEQDGIWVNFIIGGLNVLNYFLLLFYGYLKNRLYFIIPNYDRLKQILFQNFYLVSNNFSVYLQQSLMLFALKLGGSGVILGAYSVCDKIIWSTRILIIAIANAIFPSASKLFNEDFLKWRNFKQNVKLATGIIFLLGSIILFIFPNFIIHVLAGKENETAAIFLREMAFVPFLASLNSINVVDRLVHEDHYTIFKIAIIILLLASLLSFGLVKLHQFNMLGYYTLFIEFSALILYELFIARKQKLKTNNNHL
ncbi:MAG: oligosaccharide flippase family protein [Sphingobacteriales bacterium]|nr:oligosaccharide flippase family protein [Sphingobacteriales bacterium]